MCAASSHRLLLADVVKDERIDVISPTTGEWTGSVPRATPDDAYGCESAAGNRRPAQVAGLPGGRPACGFSIVWATSDERRSADPATRDFARRLRLGEQETTREPDWFTHHLRLSSSSKLAFVPAVTLRMRDRTQTNRRLSTRMASFKRPEAPRMPLPTTSFRTIEGLGPA